MMLPTHALVGLALAIPLAFVAPEFAAVALTAGLLGGVFPDLDMYAGHRRTLHYPTYFTWLAAAAIPLALVVPAVPTVAAACFLVAAAAHSVMDGFGAGLELRPWEATSERAVYDHRRGEWLAPRRWVRYDGAPEDLALAVGCALPVVLTFDGTLRVVTYVLLAVSVLYTAFRKRLPALEARIR